jgi:L-iditol 2-dehydrogenase
MMRTMQVARLVEPGRIELIQVPVPVPGPGELLVRVETSLTCGTELKTYQRGHPRIPLPTPLGHEFAGTVAATGPGVRRFREGDTIAAVPTAPCGTCRHCKRGRPSLCADAVGRMVMGAYAEYLLLPGHIVEQHVFPRQAMPAQVAAALEPLACVVRAQRFARLEGGQTVLVIGSGISGLLHIQLARARGASSEASVCRLLCTMKKPSPRPKKRRAVPAQGSGRPASAREVPPRSPPIAIMRRCPRSRRKRPTRPV